MMCPLPCSTMRYTWELEQDLQEKFKISSLASDFNAWFRGNDTDLLSTKITIGNRASEVKVIEQMYAYGSDQFFSDLGGSWGLFLGFSIVTILEYLEKCIAAMFQ